MAKKLGSVARFGSRYGSKEKKIIQEIEKMQKQKHECPYCQRAALKRIAMGIWYCKKCKTKFAGGAYTPKSIVGEAMESKGE